MCDIFSLDKWEKERNRGSVLEGGKWEKVSAWGEREGKAVKHKNTTALR